jgi:hypothetical protein
MLEWNFGRSIIPQLDSCGFQRGLYPHSRILTPNS